MSTESGRSRRAAAPPAVAPLEAVEVAREGFEEAIVCWVVELCEHCCCGGVGRLLAANERVFAKFLLLAILQAVARAKNGWINQAPA